MALDEGAIGRTEENAGHERVSNDRENSESGRIPTRNPKVTKEAQIRIRRDGNDFVV